MGLREQELAGGSHRRSTTTISTAAGTKVSGSIDLNRTFMLINIEAEVPGRIRLYTDSESRDNVTEKDRPFVSKSVGDSIGLITDATFSAGVHYFDGGVFGMSLDTGSYNCYYTIETYSSLENTIQFHYLVLEDDIDANPGTNYTVANRRLLVVSSSGAIASGSRFVGQISSSLLPKTFLIATASFNVSQSRLRLYATNSSSISSSEISRSWGTDPASSSALIADMNIDSLYNIMSPIIFTLNNSGSNIMGYVIDNLATTARSISSSLLIYSLED